MIPLTPKSVYWWSFYNTKRCSKHNRSPRLHYYTEIKYKYRQLVLPTLHTSSITIFGVVKMWQLDRQTHAHRESENWVPSNWLYWWIIEGSGPILLVNLWGFNCIHAYSVLDFLNQNLYWQYGFGSLWLPYLLLFFWDLWFYPPLYLELLIIFPLSKIYNLTY